MADSHLQVKYDGSIVDEKTNLIPRSKDTLREAIVFLFERNNWNVINLENIESCFWKIQVKHNGSGMELNVNLLLSSIRDEARQPDEFKTQFGGKIDFSRLEEGWVNIPMGAYVKEENTPFEKWILAAFNITGINFLSNPSFRGVRTKGLQLAQTIGLIENENCIIFRPEFIYYVINLFYRKQSHLHNEKMKEMVAETMSVYVTYPQPLQQIFFGAPGVGKSHHLKSVYKNESDVVRITFHPETDYSSFVGCYKPQTESNDEGSEIVYRFQGQAFTEAYIEAWSRYLNDVPRKDVFLVIEEINRGNCAQIFGDIFQLLDRNDTGFSDYSVRADKDLSQHLEKIFHDKGDEFVKRLNEVKTGLGNGTYLILPPNLHILATMNTSDQSLFPIDSAFKRRWEWVYMPIETEPVKDGEIITRKIEVNKNRYDWGTFLKEVNNRIFEITQSEDKQLGFWFVKPKNGNDIISANDFVSKVIFYLWNDIYKDYGEDATSIFNFSKDGNPESKDRERHSFKQFTPHFKEVDISLVESFLRNLGLSPERPKQIATPIQSEETKTEELPDEDNN